MEDKERIDSGYGVGSDDDLDIDAGFVSNGGGIVALVDQQRADAIRVLKTAQAVSLTMMDDADDAFTHWAIYTAPDDGATAFLVYVVCRTVRDAAAALNVEPGAVLGLVSEALRRGLAK